MSRRANHATLYVGAQLGPDDRTLDLDWATHAGDETAAHEFEVPTDDASDAYVGIQAFDVEEYGHEIRVNGDPSSGFDVPPSEGWQYWVDTLTGVSLREGTNRLRVARDTDTRDAFAVGSVVVRWTEPAGD